MGVRFCHQWQDSNEEEGSGGNEFLPCRKKAEGRVKNRGFLKRSPAKAGRVVRFLPDAPETKNDATSASFLVSG